MEVIKEYKKFPINNNIFNTQEIKDELTKVSAEKQWENIKKWINKK